MVSMMALRLGTTVEPHRVLGVVPFRDRLTVGQSRSGQPAADVGDVDHIGGDPEARSAAARVFELLGVALAVIERDEMD